MSPYTALNPLTPVYLTCGNLHGGNIVACTLLIFCIHTCCNFCFLFNLGSEVSLQVSNPTPLEGDVVEVCVVVTGVNTSESDLVVVLSATDGLASE